MHAHLVLIFEATIVIIATAATIVVSIPALGGGLGATDVVEAASIAARAPAVLKLAAVLSARGEERNAESSTSRSRSRPAKKTRQKVAEEGGSMAAPLPSTAHAVPPRRACYAEPRAQPKAYRKRAADHAHARMPQAPPSVISRPLPTPRSSAAMPRARPRSP